MKSLWSKKEVAGLDPGQHVMWGAGGPQILAPPWLKEGLMVQIMPAIL